MAQFTIYRSSDSGSPLLDGTVGSLVNLLTTVLTGPSFDGTGFAYGTTPCAGWTRSFTGTDKAVYRPGAGTRLYLRVQDDGLVTAKEARMTGYDGPMIDVDNPAIGTFPFPTAAQGTGGIEMVIARKSNTADATVRDWIIVADDRTFYLFVATGDVVGDYYCFMFGDIYSLLPGDLYHCMICGRASEDSTSQSAERVFSLVAAITSANQSFLARGYTGVGGSAACGRHHDYVKSGAATAYLGVVPFPNPSEGGTYLDRIWVHDPTTTPTKNLRGRLRGIWSPLHAIGSFANGDVITGSGELAGKTFLIIRPVRDASGAEGSVAVETSATIESN